MTSIDITATLAIPETLSQELDALTARLLTTEIRRFRGRQITVKHVGVGAAVNSCAGVIDVPTFTDADRVALLTDALQRIMDLTDDAVAERIARTALQKAKTT